MGGEFNLTGCCGEEEGGGHAELSGDSNGPRDLGNEMQQWFP